MSDFNNLDDGLLLNYICFLLLYTVFIWQINVTLYIPHFPMFVFIYVIPSCSPHLLE